MVPVRVKAMEKVPAIRFRNANAIRKRLMSAKILIRTRTVFAIKSDFRTVPARMKRTWKKAMVPVRAMVTAMAQATRIRTASVTKRSCRMDPVRTVKMATVTVPVTRIRIASVIKNDFRTVPARMKRMLTKATVPETAMMTPLISANRIRIGIRMGRETRPGARHDPGSPNKRNDLFLSESICGVAACHRKRSLLMLVGPFFLAL
jgi:hypothetical protein